MPTAAPRKRQARVAKPTAGERLVADLSREGDPYRIEVMVVEASRIADRLERLDAVLSGDKSAWLSLRLGRDKQLEIRVDSALQEARSQATCLRGLLYEIHRQRAGIAIGPDDEDDLADL